MLHPAGFGKYLRKFLLGNAFNAAAFIKKYRAAACSALIRRKYIFFHDPAPFCVNMDTFTAAFKAPSAVLHLARFPVRPPHNF